MDIEGFRSFLTARGLPEEKVDAFGSVAGRYEAFLKDVLGGASPTAETVTRFVRLLTRQGEDTHDNFRALALYGRFLKNNDVYVTILQFLDGAEALESLHEKVGRAFGEARRDEVFRGLKLPRLGTPCTERPAFAQAFIERLESRVGAARVRRLLSGGLRRIPDDVYFSARLRYLECKSIEEYLDRKGAEFVAELERIRDAGDLYFNQPMTDDVIDFVRANPETRQGVVKDGVLYETKIPYMAKEYLAEKDPRMKRYYYCHCPWVRESIRTGEAQVPPVFCHCSLGFTKQPWQVIFGRELEGEVLETVLSGGLVCRFAVKLPQAVASQGA